MSQFEGAALGYRIRAYRDARGMTLQEVADAADLTKSHVWELEQGRSRNPTVNAVWGLARALSVSPAVLLGLSDSMPPLHPTALRIARMVDRELRAAVLSLNGAGSTRDGSTHETSPPPSKAEGGAG